MHHKPCKNHQIIGLLCWCLWLSTRHALVWGFSRKCCFFSHFQNSDLCHICSKLAGMSEGGYKIRNQAAIHFITFAVVSWIDVFTRKDYRDILLDSIRFCQREKGLVVYSWCIMSNHVHLIVSARNNNLSDVLRDFKKFTSKKIITAIEANTKESRKTVVSR